MLVSRPRIEARGDAAAARVTSAVVVREDGGDHGDARRRPPRPAARALSAVMPPIATTGTPRDFACASSAMSARRAPGFTGDGKKLPNAT